MTLLSRREFLQGGALLLSSSFFACKRRSSIALPPGEILGASSAKGHLLRKGNFPQPTHSFDIDVAIVGGGIAGLSAGWWFERNNMRSYRIFELHDEVGGNALSGENSISPYPWGAHYVPVPNKESTHLRMLFEEFGVIEGYSSDGKPLYNDLYLCAAPQERLYKEGKWQEGLVPTVRVSSGDHDQYHRFFALMEQYRTSLGEDGKRAFAIPMELSSQDKSFTHLDNITFQEFLRREGFTSEPLLWYLNYCCRDDYGADASRVSAWAGVHYFASRQGWSANAGSQEELTWPEGNGWLVKKLRTRCAEHITTDALVVSIRKDGQKQVVQYLTTSTGEVTEVRCNAVIFAAPRFTAPFIIEELRNARPPYLEQFEYSPWMVANLSLSSPPDGRGGELAWDNVLYNSKSLGYVVATHQNPTQQERTVLTYYLPLSWKTPRQAREEAMSMTHNDWCAAIISDLSVPHPQIGKYVTRADLWLWGHGMIQPQAGFIWGEARTAALVHRPPLFFAHSDMSGLSLFEEAQYRGVMAAHEALKYLGGSGTA